MLIIIIIVLLTNKKPISCYFFVNKLNLQEKDTRTVKSIKQRKRIKVTTGQCEKQDDY